MEIMTAQQIAQQIENGKTLAVNGFIMAGVADELCAALEQRFLETGQPRDLTLIYASSVGDGQNRGCNRLAREGLVRRVIAGHWNLVPKIQRLVIEGRAQGYNFPQDVISMLMRDIAAHRPGHITHIGLGTFVDPRREGGRMNSITTEDLVSLIELDGKEYLYYRALPIDYALIRGTTADAAGNISMEKEAAFLEATAMAQAAHNSGGKVFVQVERISDTPLHPHTVKIPGICVDGVAIASREYHPQSAQFEHNPAYTGEAAAADSQFTPLPLDERKIIARRAALELEPGMVVNLGIGMPEGVAAVAAEEGLSDTFTLTVESGHVGGIPAGGKDFGCVAGTRGVFEQYTQFDFYHGGGLDLAILGLAQVDSHGHINVSRFGSRIAGCGGFIGITQTAKKIIFCGTFTAKGLQISIEDGSLEIFKEGQVKKFIRDVEQITFSADQAIKSGRPVLYITERAVFSLTSNGLKLDEVAPGIDVQRDILDQMEFTPIMDGVKLMDEKLFLHQQLGLSR
jgi:propionate CoA-transferase